MVVRNVDILLSGMTLPDTQNGGILLENVYDGKDELIVYKSSNN